MQIIRGMNLIADTTEESLPNFDPSFPCITNCCELHSYPGAIVPWHWHPTAELFYMGEGELEYYIPGQTVYFEQGSGGILMPEIIHKTEWDSRQNTVQFLHLFEPSLLFGETHSRMAQKYLSPMLGETSWPILKFDPQTENHAAILALLRESFALNESDFQYEFKLRQCLCEIWLRAMELANQNGNAEKTVAGDPRMKQMLAYIHAHLDEKLTIQAIADAAFVSTRVCYRMFSELLHTAPNDYIRSCRIRKACTLFSRENISVTEAAQRCGFEDSSYFGRVFQKMTGYTPREFKKMAQ